MGKGNRIRKDEVVVSYMAKDIQVNFYWMSFLSIYRFLFDKTNGNQGLTGFRKRDGHIHFREHEIYSAVL